MVWEICPGCGALVADTSLHNAHHVALGQEAPFPPVDPEPEAPDGN